MPFNRRRDLSVRELQNLNIGNSFTFHDEVGVKVDVEFFNAKQKRRRACTGPFSPVPRTSAAVLAERRGRADQGECRALVQPNTST